MFKHTAKNLELTYNGPVDESAIAARKRCRSAGNRTWASTLPAPADCPMCVRIQEEVHGRDMVATAHLTPYGHLPHVVYKYVRVTNEVHQNLL